MSVSGVGPNEQTFNKTTSANVVLRSALHNVERFGLPVPVHVEEIFIYHEKNPVITARVSECGYAWVVSGRRLFIWQYQNVQTDGSSPKTIPVCHELKLPQSDLAHRAELVAVFVSKTSSEPSCVAVSPEGMVRYWPEISQGHCSVDQRVDLNGQECDSLVEVGSLGCVFVTTTCTLVLVQYKPGNYEHQLICRTLKSGGGWLGGIGRRVSSIFFGPMNSDQGNDTKIIRLLAIPGIQQMYSIYVLAGLNFQKWSISNNEPEELKFTIDLSRQIKNAFQMNVSLLEVCDHSDIDAWVLDIQPEHEGVLILCAVANLQMSPQVFYGMAVIPTKNPNPQTLLKDFMLLKVSDFFRENNPGDSLNLRFIICGQNAFIYGPQKIISIKPQGEPDTLDFWNDSDYIFNGCIFLNLPIFFSRKHGLVAVTGNDSDINTTLGTSVMLEKTMSEQSLGVTSNNLSLYHLDPQEIYDAHRDTAGQLKAAFVFHVKNQLSECYDTVNRLFPVSSPCLAGYNGPLDTVVVEMAKDILDDIPADDPRWLHSDLTNKGLGSSQSVLVLHQLMDKQKAYGLYLKFLKESGLWNQLSGINRTNTIYLLAEFGEKIMAAITLKRQPISALFEEALERTVKTYQAPSDNKDLSRQDIFYREVSRVHEGILWLAKVCNKAAHSSLTPEDVAKTIHESNQFILRVMREVIQYRQQNAETFELNEISRSMHLEYLPWTAASGSEGLGEALLIQHNLTKDYGFIMTALPQLHESLVEDFVMLTDFILDGHKAHLASVKPEREKVLFKQYYSDRNKLIEPLIENDMNAFKSAAMLAEKYLDFDILIRICENGDNEDRLDDYMRRFKDTGFPDFVYNWYLKEGKHGKLLKRYRKAGGNVPEGQEKLGKFLSDYPKLNWMQQIFDKDFSSASETLKQLAEDETELVTRQKTMLSISKLAKLAAPSASDTVEQVADINKRLELISLQESVPDYVLQQYGFDANKPRVVPPVDLAALFISPEFVDATEVDFKRALDVASFVEDESEKTDLNLKIWRTALLRDKWDFDNIDDPVECIQNTLFFKIVELFIALGQDASNLLPSINVLLDDSSLDELNKNKKFQSLLRAGYEHVQNTQTMNN